MEDKTNVMRMLEQAGVAYTPHSYPHGKEAVDGVTKAYFGLVREGDITLRRALENLWNTPEARSDLLSFVYLALTAVFSVVCLFLRKKWKAGFAIIPLCALVLTMA